MTRVLREERGFTLVEMLVVSSLMIIVLGAVLGAFETFQRTSNTNTKVNESQDTVRVAIDTATRELRNMASPTNELPKSVLTATSTDLIFLSVAGNKPAGSLNTRNTRQVRYCLNTSTKKLWRSEQTWTSAAAPAVPGGTCGSGWPSNREVASNVVNGARPVFTYNNAVADNITEVTIALWLDPDPGNSPTEVALQSGVFLRNQNRVPTADFTMAVSGGSFVLNASASADPEGRALDFYWYDTARVDNLCGTLPPGVPTAGCIGKGLVMGYTPPAAGNRTVQVIARDPAGLQTTSSSKTCNSTGTGC